MGSKESFYFSHDSNARSDDKIIRLRAKYGARGYGIYFMIIELLHEATDNQLPRDYEAIAFELHEDAEVVKDVMENFNLLVWQNDFARSESLDRRIKRRMKISKKRQEAGRKGGIANAKQKVSKPLAIKERKGKEIKVNKIVSKDTTEQAPKVFGNEQINGLLLFLKNRVGVEAFVDSSIERNIAKHCVGLIGKIGKEEFIGRLEHLLSDNFHAKNCNKIRYLYNNIKGFVKPQTSNYSFND